MKNKLKAIAIDDEKIATSVIEHYCKDVEFIDLQKSFNDPFDGLKYLNKFPVDLVFLDIDMPGMNGLELCRKINQDALVIFITTHQELAIEGFNLDAVDYLVKPFTFERFSKAVKKAADFLNFRQQGDQEEKTDKYIFLRADYKLLKIPVADITYIEGLDDYVKVHIENQKTVVARITMKNLLEKLPQTEFIRIHRSYIVAVKRIDWVKARNLSVAGQELPLGNNYMDALSKVFKF